MSRTTAQLARTRLWTTRTASLTVEQRVQLSYERCKSVVNAYRLTADDIRNVSPKYWAFHTDPILAMDFAVATLLTIHYNLCAGTLAMYASERPDVAVLLEKLLSFDLSGQYCLTEIGHGLDIINMETTATKLRDGGFILNTPVKQAAKYMPPTSPCGIPVIAVVFARLIVDGEDRGIKPFIVHMSDGYRMNENITCKILPPRGGTSPVKHALTYFEGVYLPHSALLGSIEKERDARAAFFKNIYRVISGSLSMGGIGLSGLRISTYIAGHYSLRRRVVDPSAGSPRAIITFSTQYIPVLTSIAQTLVMEAFSEMSRALFVEAKEDIYRQHMVAAIFKATVMRFALSAPVVLGDRCGAQGLSDVNQLSDIHAGVRGAAIAEGDILVISIRFAIEIITGRASQLGTSDTGSLLYRHELAIVEELRHLLASATGHRDPLFERQVLPQCQGLIEAIGQRLAYDAAVASNVDRRLVDLFVASVMQFDPAWYAQSAGISRQEQQKMLCDCAAALLPEVEDLLAALDVKEYVTAPIVTDQSWDTFLNTLPVLNSGEEQMWVQSRL